MEAERLEIMVVDDEPKQRRGLAAMIRSLRPAHRVAEAKNGRQALEMAASRPMDIIFTDIRMPVVDGLEFLEELNESGGSRPHVVFVSVFHEFGYAQRAIRLGAKDYLVKPVNPDHLEDILVRLEEQIREERRRQAEKQSLYTELAQVKPVYREHLLYRWLKGELPPGEGDADSLQGLLRGPGTVAVLQTRFGGAGGGSDREWKDILARTIRQTLNTRADVHLCALDAEAGRLAAVLRWSGEEDPAAALGALQEAVSRLKHIYGHTVGAGIGPLTDSLERDGPGGFERAEAALEYLFYFDEDRWLTVSELERLQSHAAAPEAVFTSGTDSLEEALAEGDLEKTLRLYGGFLDRWSSSYPPPMRLKYSTVQLLLGGLKRVEALLEEEARRRFTARLDTEVLEARSLSAVRQRGAALLEELLQRLMKDRGSRSEHLMQSCKEYIESHLHEDLGLEAVAQKYFYNPSYFSMLFKAHFGLSFTDYLAKMRLQKARTLLLGSDLKVSEVARLSGYKENKYFNRVFKKTFLYTPEEFRRMFAASGKGER